MFRPRRELSTERVKAMKIKENNEKLKYSQLFLIFVPAAVVLTVMRCIQIPTVIDTKTGFYTSRSFLVVLFFVLLFAACLSLALIPFLAKQSRYIWFKRYKSKSFSAATRLFALVMLLDGAWSLVTAYDTAQDTRIFGTVLRSMMVSGAIPQLFRGFFGLLAGIYFALLSGALKKPDGDVEKHKVLALMPVGWVGCRLLNLFVRRISFLRVSELFLELCMCAFMTLFFMAFAQTANLIYSRDSRWRLAGFGLPAALIAVILNVSRLIFTIIDSEKYITENYTFCVTDLAFVAFVVVLVLRMIKPKPLPEKENTESQIVS